jgi:catechol 2,3-dioxygenase-like lactoylglutathione lyase family enzyme
MIVFGDVAVVVSDAQASAKWWKDKCGFDVRDNEGHWVTVAAPGSPTLLHLCQNGEHEEGNTGIGFVTDDLAATYEAWSGRGVAFPMPPTDRGWGLSARFADPDGNVFQLSEDKDVAPKRLRRPAKRSAKRAAKAGRKRAAKSSSRKRR